jgi:hypothetical protein
MAELKSKAREIVTSVYNVINIANCKCLQQRTILSWDSEIQGKNCCCLCKFKIPSAEIRKREKGSYRRQCPSALSAHPRNTEHDESQPGVELDD